MKVLIVEDEPLITLELEEKMHESGIQVICASYGMDGVALALREQPDVLVLDLGLPDIPGLEVLKRIQAQGLDIPTIVLTAMRDPDVKHEVHLQGVNAYFEKPFDSRLLIARMHIISKTVRQ